jgi:hypothetical protein
MGTDDMETLQSVRKCLKIKKSSLNVTHYKLQKKNETANCVCSLLVGEAQVFELAVTWL